MRRGDSFEAAKYFQHLRNRIGDEDGRVSTMEQTFLAQIQPPSGRVLFSYYDNSEAIPYLFVVYDNRTFDVFCTVYGVYFGGNDLNVPISNKTCYGYACDIDRFRQVLLRNYERERRWRIFPRKSARAIYGAIPNLGHHIWNEWCGWQTANLLGLTKGIKRFEFGYDFFGTASNARPATAPFLFRGRLLYFPALVITNEIRSQFKHKFLRKPDQEFTVSICIQLRLGNRKYMGLEMTVALILELHRLYRNVCFVIDGHSASAARCMPADEAINTEAQEFKKIVDAVGADVRIESIIGANVYEKISRINGCAVVVGAIGSGNIIPCWMLQKPAVMYGPSEMLWWVRAQEKSVPEGGTYTDIIDTDKARFNVNHLTQRIAVVLQNYATKPN